MPEPDLNLDQWLRRLEARHPVEIELGLERIAAVARRLRLGTIASRVVVVAGTNGKGSCVRTLEACALAAGLRVATYTSPHLLRYNERVRIGAVEVADESFCDAFAHIEAARGETPLTYFEVGTLAALWLMAGEDLDLAVLEVGLGGRYDAVNIVDGDLAIVTAIDLDHTHWLGDSREAIALEKAGIARAHRPVVCADPNPPATLVNYVAQLPAPCYRLGGEFGAREEGATVTLQYVGAKGEPRLYRGLPKPQLPLASVAAAVQGLALLGTELSASQLERVFAGLQLPGRYQKLQLNHRQIILDVAHNPAAASYLADRLASEPGPVNCVAAIMADKDLAGFVSALAVTVDHWYVGDLGAVTRALGGVHFAGLLSSLGCRHTQLATVEDAFDAALSATPRGATLAVCGSFFTVSAVIAHIGRHYDL
jgi:dihydrofolate synthase/folylpolyglutamate synthase